MDTDKRFEAEWGQIRAKWQYAQDEGAQLKQRIASLTEEPEMRSLLKEKRELAKNELPYVLERVPFHKQDIEMRKYTLEMRRRALSDEKLQKRQDARLKARRERLTRLEELKAPQAIIANERRMVFELAEPIEAVEKCFAEMDAESELKREADQRLIEEIQQRIATINDLYRGTKRGLEEAIRANMQRMLECRKEEIEWATQSRDHLEWTMSREPSCKSDIVHRYRTRFPEDQLLDLFPPPPASPAPQKNGGKKRPKRQIRPSAPAPVEATTVTMLPKWRFWIQFDAHDNGQELPQEREQFLTELRVVLDQRGYPSLSPRAVYDSLMAISEMEISQRHRIKRLIMDEEDLGWKIVRAGRDYRLFLLIDEERRYIRFMPRDRKTAYSGH